MASIRSLKAIKLEIVIFHIYPVYMDRVTICIMFDMCSMERRQLLLGSGALFATALAGCTSASSNSKEEAGTADHTQSDHRDTKDDHNEKNDDITNGKDEEERDHDDENAEQDDEHNEQGDIPGFDRDEFEIDSEVIQVKKLAYRNHKLDIRVMVTTTDRDVLAEELRALAPGFRRAIRDANVDAEEFFAEVQQIKFTLYDEHKNTVFAIFLDLQWLRKLLNEEMTDEEFANRCLNQMEQA